MNSSAKITESTHDPVELPEPEFPTEAMLNAYGALSFLYMRSPRHANWPVKALRRLIQPAIDLKQVRIFHYDGIPRSACLWAHLDEEAERQFLAGQPLRPAQWRSGPNLWLMEIIAPYEQGTGASAFRTFIAHIPDGVDTFRYLRVDAKGKVRRIVESTRRHDNSWGAKTIPNINERN